MKPSFDLTLLIQTLEPEHRAARLLPNRCGTRLFAAQMIRLLFPTLALAPDEGGVAPGDAGDLSGLRAAEYLPTHLESVLSELPPLLELLAPDPLAITHAFITELPGLHDTLRHDAEAMFHGDPAARSVDEVIMTYPGFLALALYRLGNFFYRHSLSIFARIITEYGHQLTGVDIHPGASIGRGCCIDHGTGIVIGETTVIEDHVKLYQGVTLGALSVAKEFANKKRHPTIERNVVLYANATVLGGDTVVGHDSIIGGSAWVTASVPPQSTVYHKSEVSVRRGSTTPTEGNKR